MKLIHGVKNLIQKGDRNEKVFYLGYDFRSKKILTGAGFDVYDTRELISETAHQIKFDFINYITEVGKKQKNSLKWWASKIASKSDLQTDFFANTCLLFACTRIVSAHSSGIIVTDDVRIYLLLKSNFDFQITLLNKSDVQKEVLLVVAKKGAAFFAKRFSFVVSRLIYNFKVQRQLKKSKEQSVFLYSWVEDRSFNKEDGKYDDPYFPDINKYVNKGIVRFCPYYARPDLIKRLAKSSKVDGLSNYSSVIKVMRSSFYLFRPKKIIPFNKYDLTSLWRFEVLSENSDSSYISHIHDYLCWKVFFSTNSGNLIYPFENQPWEKIMILANRTKKVKLLGAMHTTIHKLLLPFHTTDKELEYMPLPEWIISNSSVSQKMYESYFEKAKVKIVAGGSLRFHNNKIALKETSDKPAIGVMLSCVASQTKEQLDDLFANAGDQFQYLVKRHPDLYVDIEETDDIKIFKGSAVELYQNVQAIVYCSSTSGMEAFAFGLPVFRLRTQFLDLETGENSFSPFVINSIGDIQRNNITFHDPQPVFSEVKEEVWKQVLNITGDE